VGEGRVTRLFVFFKSYHPASLLRGAAGDKQTGNRAKKGAAAGAG